MARQTDYANIVREVFPAKLRARAEVLRFLKQFLLELDVAERGRARCLRLAGHRSSAQRRA